MSKRKISTSNALFTKAQQQVLGLLFGNPDLDFHTNEIIRLTDCGTGAVQRELKKLSAVGLILIKQVGNQKRYQVNQHAPIYNDLHNIVLKTFGLADVLIDALKPAKSQINIAFIFGSIAKHEDTSNSDIDLLLIGNDLTYADVFPMLEKTEAKLRRKINPTFYSRADWIRKINIGNHFISQILKQPKIFLIGTIDELSKLK